MTKELTEKDELAKLAKRKKQIENKYNRIAKKRLNALNKILAPKQSYMDMTDSEFKKYAQNLKIWVYQTVTAQENSKKVAQNQQNRNPQNR